MIKGKYREGVRNADGYLVYTPLEVSDEVAADMVKKAFKLRDAPPYFISTLDYRITEDTDE